MKEGQPNMASLLRLPVYVIASMLLSMSVPAVGNAQTFIPTHRLSSNTANALAIAARDDCERLGWKVSVAVVDIDGVLQAFIRGNGAGVHTVQVAQDKAFTVAGFGVPTSVINERYKMQPPIHFFAKTPHLIAGEGALPIKIGSEVVGAIGVAGSTGDDEHCDEAALKKVLHE
jgi:uncharacterized protein GlcG (DUF336 family)